MNANSHGTQDRPIQVGDLVEVIRAHPCCGSTKSLGKIFRVDRLEPVVEASCGSCGARPVGELIAWQEENNWSAYVACLKRIPPLSELEKSQTAHDLDIREPA